ncbi:unnamed protein product [Penicillium viridicatum]
MTPACNIVEWYRRTLEQLPAPTVELLLQYTGLKSEDEVKDHIYKIRDKAWQMGQTLLDLGCCFGQDLRKLAFDAGLSSTTNLIGADIEGGDTK